MDNLSNSVFHNTSSQPQNIQTTPLYSSSVSSHSNWSYLSRSSGFESQSESIDFDYDLLCSNASNVTQPESKSLDSLMESDVFNENLSLNEENQNENVNIIEEGGNIQLWQFLLELLEDRRFKNLIRWTWSEMVNDQKAKYSCSLSSTPSSSFSSTESDLYRDNEFVINDPKELAKRWATRVNKPFMNYNKFSRTLRYYYNKKKILKKTAGKPNTFYFLINIQPYLNVIHARQQHQQHQQFILQQQIIHQQQQLQLQNQFYHQQQIQQQQQQQLNYLQSNQQNFYNF